MGQPPGEGVHAQGSARPQENAADGYEHMCPRKLTKWRTESWPFSQAAWPMGHTKWKGKGAHSGMYHWLPSSLYCMVTQSPEKGSGPCVDKAVSANCLTKVNIFFKI